ncbi:MAG: fasciclin domain-containing protein [Cyclobacteriaceae bacterium]
MMKNTINPLKALAMLTVVFGLLFTTSCGEDDEEPAPTMTIVEIATSTPGLDSLAKYLSVYPDLVGLLSGDGDFTVFAPTNDAFVGLLQTPGFPSNITSINPLIIKNVLAYHVSTTRYESSALTSGASIATASEGNEAITVNADGTLLTGSSNAAIVVLETNIKATNGVIHTVGSVLIPPSVGATLTPNLGKTSGAILLGSDFSMLASAILKSEEYAATSDQIPSLLGVLAGTTSHTIFAPTNGTFEAGSLTADSFTAQQWYGILATHVVLSDVGPADLTAGASFTSASGAPLTVLTTDAPTDPAKGILTGIAIDSNGDTTPEAQVAVPSTASDALVTSNGQIHVIAGVLTPPQ